MPVSDRGTAPAAAGRRVSRVFAISTGLCAGLLASSQGAVADFTQQGNKLVGTGAAVPSERGYSVALSADGNTAIMGARADNGNVGAAWVFTRSGGVWTQQGSKLAGFDAVGASNQGQSIALSAHGNT